MLRNAEVIDEEELNQDSVSIGSKVTLLDMEYDEQITYLIVGSTEADPISGRISNESPTGTALLSRTVGETVTVEAPDGEIMYRILEIA
jgi:transcription elongation factor GreA